MSLVIVVVVVIIRTHWHWYCADGSVLELSCSTYEDVLALIVSVCPAMEDPRQCVVDVDTVWTAHVQANVAPSFVMVNAGIHPPRGAASAGVLVVLSAATGSGVNYCQWCC